ncbi:MAG: FAD-dependent oxidoreductase [Alphaproteobacteria bacterium]|nr:FAD-dependent oxidoreductase [Alphaproteobacteria bacterium]
MADFDVAIIGAGIVGASCAYALAPTHRVALVEGESRPGYHTTGRSAALFEEAYGPRLIRQITVASRPFFENPPPGFADTPLLSPRGALFIAAAGKDASVERGLAEALPGTVVEIARKEAVALCPPLDTDWLSRALYDAAAMDMDVNAIHQGYLKGFKAAGGTLLCDAEVEAMERAGGRWTLHTRAGTVRAAHVVNAAGAWADRIAEFAGARPVGIVPKRRTAFVFEAPQPADEIARWPMACEIDETFYFKPEAGLVLASPADETPSPPCDAQPEEIDVAECAARIEMATTFEIRRIRRRWAGLRCFVADKCPVLGPDPDVQGFHWAAGPGGYGIMTSPAVGRIVAGFVRQTGLPDDISAMGVDPKEFSPARRHT